MGRRLGLEQRHLADEFRKGGVDHLVIDPSQPYVDGNHVFCSVSAANERRAGFGERVVTVSTHLGLPADFARVGEVFGCPVFGDRHRHSRRAKACLRNPRGEEAHVRITHIAVKLSFGNKCRYGIYNHYVNGATANKSISNFQSLLTCVGLRN